MASANIHDNELHELIKKPETLKDRYPYARCRNCTFNGRPGVDTRWICKQCPSCPGLCSRMCFEQFHAQHGFYVFIAAKRSTFETPPTHPRSEASPSHPSQPEQVSARESTPTQPLAQESPEQSSRELLPASTWQKRQEAEHYLINKPPTQRKKAPTIKCAECYRLHRNRVERRTICHSCRKGFCSVSCMRSNHLWSGIFKNTNDASDVHLPGPSSARQFDPNVDDSNGNTSYPQSSTPMNLSAHSWRHRGPETPGGTSPTTSPSASPSRWRSISPDRKSISPVTTSRELLKPFLDSGSLKLVKAAKSSQDPIDSPLPTPSVEGNNPSSVLPTAPVASISVPVRKRPRHDSPEDTVQRVTRSKAAAIRKEDGSYEALDKTVSSYSSSDDEET